MIFRKVGGEENVLLLNMSISEEVQGNSLRERGPGGREAGCRMQNGKARRWSAQTTVRPDRPARG